MDTGHVTQILEVCLFWKLYPGWRDVRWVPWIIDKMTDFWKVVLKFSQCQKYIDQVYWVYLALVSRFRNYKLLYFLCFTEIDAMSEEHPELTRKWRIYGKSF